MDSESRQSTHKLEISFSSENTTSLLGALFLLLISKHRACFSTICTGRGSVCENVHLCACPRCNLLQQHITPGLSVLAFSPRITNTVSKHLFYCCSEWSTSCFLTSTVCCYSLLSLFHPFFSDIHQHRVS